MTGRRATTDVRPGRLALSVGAPEQDAPPGWRWVSLSEIATMATGHTPSRKHPEYWGGDIPWMNVGDARPFHGRVIHETSETTNALGIENSAAVVLPAGTVCLSRTGSIGYAVILGRPMATSQGFVNWICGPELLPRFLQQIFLAEQAFLHEISEGVAHTTIYFPEAKAFHVCIPGLEHQRAIVAEIEKQFSRLDEAVANLKRVKANLKRYKAAVLRAAVTGELAETRAATAGRSMAAQESGAELLARVLRARRAQWSARGTYPEPITPDTTDLPLLPKGWVWATTDQLSDFITKGTTPAANLLSQGEGEVQFLKVYNLTFDGTLNRGYKPAFVSRRTHERDLARSKVRPGDVLINIVGPPLGQVSVVPDDLPEANINQAIARIRPIEPLSTRFMALCLRADVVIGWAIRRAKTTAGQANLTLELCRALPIPLPPLAEQQRIAAQVDRLLSFADQVEAAISLSDERAKAVRMATLRSSFEPQHL